MDNAMSISNPQNNHQFPQEQTLNLGINAQPPPTADEPTKRRPGRPKGSVKKALLGEPSPSKAKRPVGRPRKDGLPAGSVVVPAKPKKERMTQGGGPQFYAPEAGFQGGVAYPSMYPPGSFVAAPILAIDPNLAAGDEWATLARNDANALLTVLLEAMAAPNPVSSGGPTVEEAFKMHLASLAPNQHQSHPIPSLYSILKTFWLPSSPAYFSLTASAASTARTPSEHRFLYWDPLPLVFNGIACPQCGTPLINKGRISSGPLKIYDIEKPFFIIGCEYVCKGAQCMTPATSEGRKFASTDSSILRALPVKLKDEFPAKLLYDNTDAGSGRNIWNWKAMGVSWSLWNMVHGALRSGLKKEVIMHLVHSIQRGGPTVDEPPKEPKPVDAMQVDTDAQQQSTSTPTEPVPIEATEPSDFSEAYNNAWKENTAEVSADPPPPVKSPAPTQPPQPSASTTTPIPTSQNIPTPQTFPYPYPYATYGYLGINGSMVPLQTTATSSNHAVPTSTTELDVVPNHSPPTQSLPQPQPQVPPPPPPTQTRPATTKSSKTSGSTATKRSPRHCCKCGSQECKGKGGRNFCPNACQDCGKLDCRGRNSRRPDKKCSEGWA